MILWASSFVALKVAFRTYHPMVVIFGRMAVASLCFLFFIRRFRFDLGRFQKGDLKAFLFMAGCEPCLYYLFEVRAIENTSASQAGIIAAMLPLLIAVAARYFLNERISKKTLAGFFMAIVGACWLSAAAVATTDSPNPVLGNFLEFLAMVSAVGYMITVKKLVFRYSPLFLTAFQAFAGAVFFLPFLFFESTKLPTRLEPVGACAIVYLGAFVTLGAYWLYNHGMSRIPATQASAFVNLIPAFCVLLGWLVLGEQLTHMQYIAAALIVLGVYISQEKTRITENGRDIS